MTILQLYIQINVKANAVPISVSRKKRDIEVAFIFLLNQVSTLRDCEKQ